MKKLFLLALLGSLNVNASSLVCEFGNAFAKPFLKKTAKISSEGLAEIKYTHKESKTVYWALALRSSMEEGKINLTITGTNDDGSEISTHAFVNDNQRLDLTNKRSESIQDVVSCIMK